METFDYIIIGLGVALIAIGLILFVLGKRDSQNGNQVEGFGIKLNVSNPSIILIVFGIGLVLFPRLMPNNSMQSISNGRVPFSSQPQQNTEKPELEPINNPQSKRDDSASEPNSAIEPKSNVPQTSEQSPTANMFVPQGAWYLTRYQEGGIDLSGNINGNIRFNQRSNTSHEWHADMVAVDGWGNVMNYYYKGVITVLANGYSIETNSSNDPNFFQAQSSQLIMQMDNPNSLHMEYAFNGANIILHWSHN